MENVYDKLSNMLMAYYPIIYLTGYEYYITIQKIRSIIKGLNCETNVYLWNCATGLTQINEKKTDKGNVTEYLPIKNTENGLELLRRIDSIQYVKGKAKDVYILEDFNQFLNDNRYKYYIRKIAEQAKYNNSHIIILSACLDIPIEIEKYITVLNIPLPSRSDIDTILGRVASDCGKSLSFDLRNKLLDSALGLTINEAELAFCLAAVKDNLGEKSPYIVSSEKEQIIRKSGILDYFSKNESLADVGGLEVLKEWLRKRKIAYNKKARDWGLQEPKGILLLGMPGCGKSLTAKCIASYWDMPLLRLDIGKVFQGIIGSSEDNIRKAISTAEAVAPCVLWIDEIEKGLNGVQSSGETDGGTTSRIFSTILTWMQEKTKPVFVVATANNIDALPPELLRKGRFDEIFFIDLPNTEERKTIFSIHLEKRGQDPQKNAYPLNLFAEKTDGFSGAEIETCIKEAMFVAYAENPDNPILKASHILDALENTITLSKTMGPQIKRQRELSQSRAKNASIIVNSQNKKECPIMLTLSELEQQRSFDIKRTDEK